MSWAIEEYCEDAIAAYLNQELQEGLIDVHTAWTVTEPKYPCAIVRVGVSDNLTGEFNGHRDIEAGILIMSEAVADGVLTARNANRLYRDAVLTALAQTELQDDINALNPVGIVFTLAQVTKIERAVEPGKRVFTSEIMLQVIASPKDL